MKSIERFSSRVESYVKFRPSYPDAAITYLAGQFDSPSAVVCADFGSGTGILSGLLARSFAQVFGIEPNQQMRAAAEHNLQHLTNFISVNGTAEFSGLPDKSVDMITAAQAFHWFDQSKFKLECRRIIKPGGFVALIWNNRLTNTPFLQIYDNLLKQYATDYNEVNHQNVSDSQLQQFFSSGYALHKFPNHQMFDLNSLFGRLDSSSYAPLPGSEAFGILRKELQQAFEQYQQDGKIAFNYETEIYLGRV